MSQHVYLREVDLSSDDSLAHIVSLISPGSTVLDVGTGSGALGRYLKQFSCITDGVTFSQNEADLAASAYRVIKVANLEECLPSSLFPLQKYDFIVCADILEHLRNAQQVLSDVKSLLKPDGALLISLPNPTYMGVVLSLLATRFVRTSEGLLDATHVQFMDRIALTELVQKCGFVVNSYHDVKKALHETEFKSLAYLSFPEALRAYIESLDDVLVYQFVWRLKLEQDANQKSYASYPALPQIDVVPRFSLQLFFDRGNDFNEEDCSISWGSLKEKPQTISWSNLSLKNVSSIRLDFSDRRGLMEFHEFRILDQNKNSVFEWNGNGVDKFVSNDCEWLPSSGIHGGRLVRVKNNDPWICLPMHICFSEFPYSAEIRLTAPQIYEDAAFAWAERRYCEQFNVFTELLQVANKREHAALLKCDVLENKLSEINSKLNLLENSTSWRVTACLRKIAHWLRGFK